MIKLTEQTIIQANNEKTYIGEVYADYDNIEYGIAVFLPLSKRVKFNMLVKLDGIVWRTFTFKESKTEIEHMFSWVQSHNFRVANWSKQNCIMFSYGRGFGGKVSGRRIQFDKKSINNHFRLIGHKTMLYIPSYWTVNDVYHFRDLHEDGNTSENIERVNLEHLRYHWFFAIDDNDDCEDFHVKLP